jgi:hypothetical protein
VSRLRWTSGPPAGLRVGLRVSPPRGAGPDRGPPSWVTSLAARFRNISGVWPGSDAGASLKRVDEVRKTWVLAANGFADIVRDMMWLHTMSLLSDLASFVGDVRRAAMLYDLLLPYVDRCGRRHRTCRGAVARPLRPSRHCCPATTTPSDTSRKALEMKCASARASGSRTPARLRAHAGRARDRPATGRKRRSPRRRSPRRARSG